MEPLKCEKMIRVMDPARDNQGKIIWYHRRCNEPAAEYEFGGMLTSVKAVFCEFHKRMADKENFVSQNGFRHGQVKKKLLRNGYQQPRLDGTGIR